MRHVVVLVVSAIASGLWAGASHAESIRIGGTGSAMAAMRVAGDAFQKVQPGATVSIVNNLGSRGGLQALQAGVLDLAVTAGSVPAGGDLVAVELGRTPMVFVTTSPSGRAGVSVPDLVEIYSGRRTTWRDGSRLRVVLRPPGDADIAFLRALSPAMSQAVDAGLKLPGVKLAATDQDAADAIASIPGAVGASTLLLVLSETRAFSLLSIGGVPPGLTAMADGSYPYYRTIRLVTRGEPRGLTGKYVAFLASPAGRQLLNRLGLQVSPALRAGIPDAR
jgi:phosphate transport system substrate-binding protein